jgi:endonuclease G, mitochondrial
MTRARRGFCVALLGALLAAPAAAQLPEAVAESWGGLPQGPAELAILWNPGFVVGYSERRRQALWVAYRAETLKGTPPLGPRPRFDVDPRTQARVTDRDYRGTGFTRGHLAPNYLIGKLYGAGAQRATFLMSNIAPQSRRLNELVWQRLEEAESNTVAPAAIQLWVTVGPLFAPEAPVLKSGVAVPEAFYRIWLDVEAGVPRVLAFIVPQDVCGTEPLSRYLASVDEVERRAGLDFFSELPDVAEEALESRRDTTGWGLPRFERRPPRYADRFGALECDAG